MLDVLELVAQPVALLAWCLVALAWRAWRAPAPPGVRHAAAAVTLLYFAAATPLGANVMVGALEDAATRAARDCGDGAAGGAIVVLAGGMSGSPASRDEVARLHEATLRRLLEAVRLARAAPESPLVLSGGGGGAVREADLMASLATALGVPPERLRLERESRTTAEGATRVARLLAPPGGSPPAVLLVTSAMHVPRAAAAFRRSGLRVCPVPVDRRWGRPEAHEALVPQVTALEKSSAALHELAGYVAYWATGRL
jgi:uncharacterized SAM-binding protein YcdF (DUF218 family)